MVDRHLGVRRREQVEAELRDRGDEDERGRHEEERKGKQQVGEIAEPFPVEGGAQQAPGVGEGGLEDLARRVAERAVAVVEAGRGAVVEVRQDELDRDAGEQHAERRDCAAGDEAPPGNGVPDAHPGDHERDLLLRQRGQRGEDGEGNEAVLVEVPEGKEQERARERDGVELVQREPLHGRVEQIRQREAERGPLRAEVLAGEPEHRERAERDRDGLGREEHARARPEPPERREEDEDRIDVRAEPRDLLALEVRHRQRVPVRGRPDGLGHVAEVEPPDVERAVAEDGEGAEAARVGGDRRPQEPFRPGGQSSSSIKDRHLAPSTSSLARSS